LTARTTKFKIAARSVFPGETFTCLMAMARSLFTDSELKVIALRVNGIKPDEIARLLGFKRRKVNDIVSRVYRKVGVDSIVRLTLWAHERGLDKLPPE
jgi:DNA-binding CsgD family transcriptional regulator